jgi:Rps23 Pro-64 3,4-dihydroxylase Tpa1-like proline 4-hydroxylase
MDKIITILSTWGLGQWGIVVLIVSIFIDLSPIKFNPIKMILSWFGRYLNKSIQTEITGFKEEVSEKLALLQEEQTAQRNTLDKIVRDREAREISRLKWEVIEFETSIRDENGMKHSREQYRHILDEADKYERIAVSADSLISIPQVDLLAVQEAASHIKSHYDNHRDSQDLYF